MLNRATFPQKWLPYFLIAPQLAITLVFFVWPAWVALMQAFYRGDAFGIHSKFVGFVNFYQLLTSNDYLHSFGVTLAFSLAVTMLCILSGLMMAVLVNRLCRGTMIYKTLLMLPYAVAPAIAGLLWFFLFNPTVGILGYLLRYWGYDWNFRLYGNQAMAVVIIAAAWQQFSYNFLFYSAGLQAIPPSLLEAAAIDGAGEWQQFRHIIFPLLSPTTFFLFVINLIYAFFDTFGVIHVMTQGGPAEATNILVYKVYKDGFLGLDLGGSAAQSVILMTIVIILTFVQFRYIEKKVHYA